MSDAVAIETAGRRALRAEAEGLVALAARLPDEFAEAAQAILAVKGRVIVSGLGKSGHVGRKIAATLASTGTPAQFVHAAEAVHGDLGMLTPADLALLLSNSGETPELQAIVAHARRFSIPTAAICGRPESTLMRAADYRLPLPQMQEACGLEIVPTTSTTMMLALGDALAIALMEQRQFGRDNFSNNHPGGNLGARLLRVRRLMHSGAEIPLVDHAAPMCDVLIEMTSKGFGITGVLRHGRLEGVITDGDLRRNMHRLMSCRAGDVATPAPLCVAPDALAVEALALMNGRKVSALFVTSSDGSVEGILHIHDCLRAGVA